MPFKLGKMLLLVKIKLVNVIIGHKGLSTTGIDVAVILLLKIFVKEYRIFANS